MTKIYLALALHNHQPVGNFDFVFEEAYQKSYYPLLQALEKHPKIRLAIHNTGCLYDWIVANHPEYMERMGTLVARGQVEIMTGGYYEPILVSLPDVDKHGQIRKLTDAIKGWFNTDAQGAWLAERVWEPHLPKSLNEAGVGYTIVDDTHFRYAGLTDDDMFGYYVTEEQGKTVKIFGTAKELRYRIPWVPVQEVIDWLRLKADEELPLYHNVPKIAVMGDDGEKFGLWPRTFDHCWKNGWVDQFFSAIEANSEWLQTIHLSEYANTQRSLGSLYMPTASYDEMTEWALPAKPSADIVHLKHELAEAGETRILQFIKGGLWRGFQTKYPEVNQMNKRALWVSRLANALPDGETKERALAQLWSAQCNCGYWHGLFGGIYLFHIRGANYRNLISAETTINPAPALAAHQLDFTCSGNPDLILENQHQWMLFDQQQGGAMLEWDFRDAPYNLLNTVSRRFEGYHADIKEAAKAGTIVLSSLEGEIENLHTTTVRVREYGLEHKLIYDWYRRGALHTRFLHPYTPFESYTRMEGEMSDFVNQPFELSLDSSEERIVATFVRFGGVWQDAVFAPVRLAKEVILEKDSSELTVNITILNQSDQTLHARFGIENNWGLEGGQDPMTYFVGLQPNDSNQRSVPGRAGMAAFVSQYGLISDISTVMSRIQHEVSQSADVWWYPIETVTNSEAGYESSYQGTAVLTSWQLHIPPHQQWSVTLKMKLSRTG